MLQLLAPGPHASLELLLPNAVAQQALHFADTRETPITSRRFTLTYAFYQAVDVEHTEIATQRGNDVVHGDAGFHFPNNEGEWGIASGGLEQRGLINALQILGGPGADQLYGGAEDDYIDGGEGDDFIFGMEGNDTLHGGSGNDLIVGDGNNTVLPDRYETVARGDRSGANDHLEFAALLEPFSLATSLTGLSFHQGDQGDWYIVPAPTAFHQFGDAKSALLTADMIDVRSASRGELESYLFAAENRAAPGQSLNVVPVEAPTVFRLLLVTRTANRRWTTCRGQLQH